MKTLNNRWFSSKITEFKNFICRILQKIRKIRYDFFQKSGNLPFHMHNTDKSNTIIRENSWIIGIFHMTATIFANFLQFYVWFYKGKKCKYFSYHTKICCSIISQNESCTNYQNCCRKHWKFIKLSTSHNRNINSNLWEILTYCKAKFGIFLKCHGYCHTIIANCSYTNCQKKQLIAHKVYCEEKYTKVLQIQWLSFTYTLYDSLMLQTQLGASHKVNNN